MTQRWNQWQVTLSDNARILANHQEQLSEQTEALIRNLGQQLENSELDSSTSKIVSFSTIDTWVPRDVEIQFVDPRSSGFNRQV